MGSNPIEPDSRERLTGWPLALYVAPVFLSVLLLLLLPFLTNPRGFDPLLPKRLLVQIVVYGMLLVYCLQSARQSGFSFLKAPFWTPLMLLMVWVLLTAFLSPYSRAVWARLPEGVLPVLWFTLLYSLFREIWRVENLLISFLAGALGVSIWSVGQAAGWIQGPWTEVSTRAFGGRVVAGMGNPNFLAGYLLTAWPLALALLLRAHNRYARAWWGVTLFFVVTALALTGSRSGWLALAVGSLVFALFFLPNAASKAVPSRKVALGFLLLILAVTPFTAGGKRLFRSMDASDDGWRFRRQVWSGTLDLIRERPVTGWGLGAFQAAFPSKRPSSLALDQTRRQFVVDHAHNAVLEWTAETGLVGLALLAWFWAAVFTPWWRLTKGNAIPRALGAAAFASAAGALVSNLLDVNHATWTTLAPLGMIAAMPSALSQRFHHVEGSPVRHGRWDLKKAPQVVWAVAILAAGLFFHQVYSVLRKQNADIQMAGAVESSRTGQWDKAVEGYHETLSSDPGLLDGWYFLGSALLERDLPGDAQRALEAFSQVESREPDFAQLHTQMSLALIRSGREAEARSRLKKAVALDPWIVLGLPDFQKARSLAQGGNPREALPLFERLDLEYPDCFPILVDKGNCMALLKRYDEATRTLEKARTLKPDSVDALLNLSYVALARRDLSDARRFLDTLLGLHILDNRIDRLAEELQKAEPR